MVTGFSQPQATVKLEISCKGLRDRDLIGKSDPCAIVFLENLSYESPQGYPTASASSLPPAQSSNYPLPASAQGAGYQVQPPLPQHSSAPPGYAQGSPPPHYPSSPPGYAQGPPPPSGYPSSGYGAPASPAPHQPGSHGAPPHVPSTSSFNAQNAAVGYSVPASFNGYQVPPTAPPQSIGTHLPHQGAYYAPPGWPQAPPQDGYGNAPPAAPPGGGYTSGGWAQPGYPPGQHYPPRQQYPPYGYDAPPGQTGHRGVSEGNGSGASRSGRAQVALHPPASSPDKVISWKEVGRTEVIQNNLNPHFSVQVSVPYKFEEVQNIRIGIWDIDNSNSKKLGDQDFLGDIHTTLGDLVANAMTQKRLRAKAKKNNTTVLGGKRNLGTITIIVHEDHLNTKWLVGAYITGKKLAKRDLFSSDPYLIIRQVKDVHGAESRAVVYQSEVVKKNLNPVWRKMKFKIEQGTSTPVECAQLELQCMDEDRGSKDEEIGTARCTLNEFMNMKSVPLIHSKKKSLFGSKNSGELIIQRATKEKVPSWIHYLQGGLRLHFTLAIDFTRSNGDPSTPGSLHYIGHGYENQYISAISAVGNVLRPYTQGEVFNAYGFGAILPGYSETSFCFPLSLRSDPRCSGVTGVIQEYQNALKQVVLHGPTNFSHIIDTCMKTAMLRENSAHQQNYDVLLILTDGAVTDFNQTVETIIRASHSAPLSIIMVGVGNADFKRMEAFDADHELLTNHAGTRKAARDIVQFVPMNRFNTQQNYAANDSLAAAVLAELPSSIVDYYFNQEQPIMPMKRQLVPVMSARSDI